jgi:hypothetical protein
MAASTLYEQSIDVFVSYAREDLKLAEQLKREFQLQCLRCWIDIYDIPFNHPDYPEFITEAVDKARTLVVLWTSNSTKSSAGECKSWVRSEAQRARDQHCQEIQRKWAEIKADVLAEIEGERGDVP